ncbi:MAG: hypothetical protein KKB34_19550 [Bacteroidetes bacterium]|nr:hypothetical protein [Bacteroidota bacterium]
MRITFSVLIKYVAYTVLPIIIFSVIGLIIWRSNINNLNSELQNKVSSIIKTTINQQAEKGLLTPEVFFINVDSSKAKELNKELKNKIITTVTELYVKNKSPLTYDEVEIKPFYLLPEKANKSGQYILTESQLNILKEHIIFLAKQVEVETNRTKEEVGRDIERLNTWVTIWIGFIGLIGIFIPIIINIDTSKNATEAKNISTEAKNQSELAKTTAENAKQKIDDAESSIKKITGIEITVNKLLTDTDAIETLSKEASVKSEKALEEAQRIKGNLSIITAINKLKEFSPQFLAQYEGKNATKVLKNILTDLFNDIKNNTDNYDSPYMDNWIKQIVTNIQNLSLLKVFNQVQTKGMNEFSRLITESLSKDGKSKFETVSNELEKLIKEL